MRHRGRRRCAMPVLQTGRKPDDVTWPDFLDCAALALNPAKAGGHDQGLPERMRVPRRARARLECHVCAGRACRIVRAEERVDADRTGEISRRPLWWRAAIHY